MSCPSPCVPSIKFLLVYRGRHAIMDTKSSNNDSGISDSISDESRNSNTPVLPRHNNATHNKHGRQAVRKMSTMQEEEDIVSDDDADPDVIKIGHQQQKRSEIEPEWTSEEGSRLLNSAERKIVVAPTTASNARRTINRNDSTETVQDQLQSRWPQSRPLIADQIESRSSPGRDNEPHSPGRLSVKSVDQQHATRHYHCSNARSPRTPVIMNENQQQCPCCHQPSSAWASILYADSANEARMFPDTISIRSLASIGLGSSDGRKLTIRRVPTSPSELLNVVHPPP